MLQTLPSADPAASSGEKSKKKAAKKKDKRPSNLSFEDELDNEPEPSPTTQPKKMGKCQAVDVSFLKKNASEAQAEAQRQEQAMRDFLLMQQQAKKEPVTLRYAFRSEATQRE